MASAAGSRGLSGASSRLASSLRNIGTAAHNDDPTLSSTESFTDINSSDDEEIVWSISDLSVVSVPHTSSDDEDYVLLGRADSPIAVHSIPSGVTSLSASVLESRAGLSSADGLSDVFSRLQVEADDSDSESEVRPASQATTRRRTRSRPRRSASSTVKKASAQAPPATPARAPAARSVPTNVQAAQDAAKAAAKKARLAARKAAEAQGLSKVEVKKAGKKAAKKARKAALSSSVSSSSASTSSQTATSSSVESSPAQSTRSVSFYQDAVEYISAFLSTPSHKPKSNSDLTFLQALIIELGLCPDTAAAEQSASETSFANLPSLPRSLRAAKALLKERVFVNVRDYLDMRGKGFDALQSVMHPSRKALIKDLSRGKGQRKVPRTFVKESGLGVLLVTCYH